MTAGLYEKQKAVANRTGSVVYVVVKTNPHAVYSVEANKWDGEGEILRLIFPDGFIYQGRWRYYVQKQV